MQRSVKDGNYNVFWGGEVTLTKRVLTVNPIDKYDGIEIITEKEFSFEVPNNVDSYGIAFSLESSVWLDALMLTGANKGYTVNMSGPSVIKRNLKTNKAINAGDMIRVVNTAYNTHTVYLNGEILCTLSTGDSSNSRNTFTLGFICGSDAKKVHTINKFSIGVADSPPVISLGDTDLGDILEFEPINFSIHELDNQLFSLIEKLDGKIIRELQKQTSETTYTLKLNDTWNSIEYGSHLLEIFAIDETGNESRTAINFFKSKKPVIEIPLNSSLTQIAKHFELINEEVSFQSIKLKDTLSKKGISTTETDSISILIDKIKGLPSMAMYEEVKLNSEKIKNLEKVNIENEKKISILEGEQETQNEEILSNMLATTEVFEMILEMSTPMSVGIKNKKLGGNSMVEVYVTLILKGVKTIDQVPSIIRDQVKEQLDLLTK